MTRVLLLLLAVAACTGSPAPDSSAATMPDSTPPPVGAPAEPRGDSVVTVTGTVRHFEFEGGFFAIRGDDSVTYDPTNLAEEFRRDGLRVHARLRLRPDMGGIHMAGPIVDIVEIRRDE